MGLYGLQVKRADGTIIASPSSPSGRLFIQKIEVTGTGTAGTNTSFTFPTVPTASNLRIVPLGTSRPCHYIYTGANTTGTTQVSLVERTIDPNYGGSKVTQLMIFSSNTYETLTSTYGLSTLNDANERIISATQPCIQFLGKLVANTTPYYSYTAPIVTSNTIYNHTANASSSFTIQPYQQLFIAWSLPSTTSQIWFYPGEASFDGDPDPNFDTSYFYNPGPSAMTVAAGEQFGYFTILKPPSTSITNWPEGFVFAVDKMAASTDQYGLRIRDASGNITFDSGLNHAELAGYETTLTIQSTLSASTFSGITPATTLPTYASITSSTSLGTRFSAGFYRRNGTSLDFTRLIHAAYPAPGPNYSYVISPVGSTNVIGTNLTMLVTDATRYGGSAI